MLSTRLYANFQRAATAGTDGSAPGSSGSQGESALVRRTIAQVFRGSYKNCKKPPAAFSWHSQRFTLSSASWRTGLMPYLSFPARRRGIIGQRESLDTGTQNTSNSRWHFPRRFEMLRGVSIRLTQESAVRFATRAFGTKKNRQAAFRKGSDVC